MCLVDWGDPVARALVADILCVGFDACDYGVAHGLQVRVLIVEVRILVHDELVDLRLSLHVELLDLKVCRIFTFPFFFLNLDCTRSKLEFLVFWLEIRIWARLLLGSVRFPTLSGGL